MFCNTHYSYDCDCPAPAAPAAPSLPAAVWVVVELYTKSVQVGRAAATGTISGKAAIFHKPEVVQQLAGRIVGVYDSENVARSCCPNLEGAEYIIEHRFIESGTRMVADIISVQPQDQKCALCNAPAASTFCAACQADRFRQMRERDGEIIAEKTPVIKSDFAFEHPLPSHA